MNNLSLVEYTCCNTKLQYGAYRYVLNLDPPSQVCSLKTEFFELPSPEVLMGVETDHFCFAKLMKKERKNTSFPRAPIKGV